jgi:choline dehydrogenase-like flavoprotein
MRRANLTVETGALVTRIVLRGGRAVEVEYVRRGRARSAPAAGEVIVCAGAYGSPQLLMLSGIGAADELRAHGIAPVHDLPGVGRELADHPVVIAEYELRDDLGLTRHLRADRAAWAAARWFAGGRGPFAYTGTVANVFLRSSAGLDRPDMQMMCLPLSGDARIWAPGLQRRPAAKLSVRTGYLPLKSRGWVRLRSADPRDPPRILLNLFSAPGYLRAEPTARADRRRDPAGRGAAGRRRAGRARPPPCDPPRAPGGDLPDGRRRRRGGRRAAAGARDRRPARRRRLDHAGPAAWKPQPRLHDDRRESGRPDPRALSG